MNTKQTQRNLIFSSSALVLVIVGYGVFFATIQKSVARTSEVTREVLQEEERQKRFRSLEQILADSAADRSVLSGYFLTNEDIVTFIQTIEEMGATAGVDLTTQSVGVDGNTTATNVPNTLRMQVSVIGSWSRVVHFIALLEALPQQHVVRSMFIERIGSEEETPIWNAAFTIHVPLI